MLSVSLQAVALFVGFYNGGVFKEIKGNAYAILGEQVSNRSLILQTEMLTRWSNIDYAAAQVLDRTMRVLAVKDAQAEQTADDYALNEQILLSSTDVLIETLRRNSVTGVFMVLDGALAPGMTREQSRAGVYIRDLDPQGEVSYSEPNADLLMLRGLTSVARGQNITLDMHWTAGFEFTGEQGTQDEQFFFTPLRAAQKAHAAADEGMTFGYWSPMFDLNTDTRAMSYSVPLISPEGTVFGVIGVEISEEYLRKQLHYAELAQGDQAAYALAVTGDGETFDISSFSARSTYGMLGGSTVLTIKDRDGHAPVFELKGGRAIGSIVPLTVYENNAPFEDEQWALIGLVYEDELLAFSRSVEMLVRMVILLSLALGLLSALVAGRIAASPIENIAHSLTSANLGEPIALGRINVREIDQLSASLEQLSNALAESSHKLTRILSMTKVRVGVFEHKAGDAMIFCSRSLFELLDWERVQGDYEYLPIAVFDARMRAIEYVEDTKEGQLFRVCNSQGDVYVEMICYHDENEWLGTMTDTTREVLERRQIEYERDYDSLTHLYNRRGFDERANQALCAMTKPYAAMLMLDLDNLKYVNDTYGHTMGDRYICALSDALRPFVGEQCIAARRSGDEFNLLFYGYDDMDLLNRVVEQVCGAIRESWAELPTGGRYRLRASGGVAYYPKDAKDVDTLVRYADFAMYQVKHSRKGEVRSFDMYTYQGDQILLSGQEALDNLIDFALVEFAMQPIVSVRTGEIYGYEMLMRSRDPRFSGPEDVLRVAAAQSKLYQIERLTWFGAMRTFVKAKEEGRLSPDAHVFINSIADCILSEDDASAFLLKYRGHMQALVLEITETEKRNEAFMHKKYEMMNAHGAQIAVDDYGSGYNCDMTLLELSPQFVKIDRAITRGCDTDDARRQIIRNLIAYARQNDIHVLAEGVETKAETEALIAYGVEYLQGYFIARPEMKPVKEISEEAARTIRDCAAGVQGGR